MKTSNKIKLANLTTWTMVITIIFISIFFIGFVVTNTFDLNVFTKQASSFIFSFIGFSSVIVLCSAILNISLNISLIADSKIQDLKYEGRSFINLKFILYSLGTAIIVIAFLFFGDFLTRQHEKTKLIAEANDIVKRYKVSIDKISIALTDTSNFDDIPKILNFLSEQKEEFPSVSIISSHYFDGQLSYIEIDEHHNFKPLKNSFYNNSFYKCSINDCDYLNSFFTGKTNESHFWTEDNDYKLYMPFNNKNKPFILLFTKYSRDGKIGSRY